MANENKKFKIHVESDGENVAVKCEGKVLDVCAGISMLLVVIAENIPGPLLKRMIIKEICQTALSNIEHKKEEDMSFEGFIAEIFKN